MLSRILGEDIYRSVNVEYCMKIKKQKEKLKDNGLREHCIRFIIIQTCITREICQK